MKLVVIRYSRERGHDDPEQAKMLLHAAETIKELPGLRWKIWTYNDAERVAGECQRRVAVHGQVLHFVRGDHLAGAGGGGAQ